MQNHLLMHASTSQLASKLLAIAPRIIAAAFVAKLVAAPTFHVVAAGATFNVGLTLGASLKLLLFSE